MNAPKARSAWRPVHGVLLLDKPRGMSSNDALQKARRLFNAEKAGHTGTLDPLATGLLPCCFGSATKFSQTQLDADKAYIATLKLGVTTTTGDVEGDVVQCCDVSVTDEHIQEVLHQFVGKQQQTPHKFSAVVIDGKRAYEYARAGKEVEIAAREIEIYDITLRSFQANEIVIEVSCSKGTYIRVLAEDMGKALGCGAHLSALRRVRTGGFTIEQAVSLSDLESMTLEGREQCLLPTSALLSDVPKVTLNAHEAGRFLTGLRRRVQHQDTKLAKVYGDDPHLLLATAHILAGELIPTRLLSPLEIAQTLAQNFAKEDASQASLQTD